MLCLLDPGRYINENYFSNFYCNLLFFLTKAHLMVGILPLLNILNKDPFRNKL